MRELVRDAATSVLGVSAGSLDDASPLAECGLDSLSGTELLRLLSDQLGGALLAPTLLLEAESLGALAESIERQLDARARRARPRPWPPHRPAAAAAAPAARAGDDDAARAHSASAVRQSARPHRRRVSRRAAPTKNSSSPCLNGDRARRAPRRRDGRRQRCTPRLLLPAHLRHGAHARHADACALRAALGMVVARHDAMRTRLATVPGQARGICKSSRPPRTLSWRCASSLRPTLRARSPRCRQRTTRHRTIRCRPRNHALRGRARRDRRGGRRAPAPPAHAPLSERRLVAADGVRGARRRVQRRFRARRRRRRRGCAGRNARALPPRPALQHADFCAWQWQQDASGRCAADVAAVRAAVARGARRSLSGRRALVRTRTTSPARRRSRRASVMASCSRTLSSRRCLRARCAGSRRSRSSVARRCRRSYSRRTLACLGGLRAARRRSCSTNLGRAGRPELENVYGQLATGRRRRRARRRGGGGGGGGAMPSAHASSSQPCTARCSRHLRGATRRSRSCMRRSQPTQAARAGTTTTSRRFRCRHSSIGTRATRARPRGVASRLRRSRSTRPRTPRAFATTARFTSWRFRSSRASSSSSSSTQPACSRPVAQRAVDAMVALLADFAAIEDTQAALARPAARARRANGRPRRRGGSRAGIDAVPDGLVAEVEVERNRRSRAPIIRATLPHLTANRAGAFCELNSRATSGFGQKARHGLDSGGATQIDVYIHADGEMGFEPPLGEQGLKLLET